MKHRRTSKRDRPDWILWHSRRGRSYQELKMNSACKWYVRDMAANHKVYKVSESFSSHSAAQAHALTSMRSDQDIVQRTD